MEKVVSSSNSPSIVRKKQIPKRKATLSRVATDLWYMADVSFGELDSNQDGKVVSYDSTQNKFVLISADQVLIDSVDDNDVPDDFVRNIEDELDTAALTEGLDGGTF